MINTNSANKAFRNQIEEMIIIYFDNQTITDKLEFIFEERDDKFCIEFTSKSASINTCIMNNQDFELFKVEMMVEIIELTSPMHPMIVFSDEIRRKAKKFVDEYDKII